MWFIKKKREEFLNILDEKFIEMRKLDRISLEDAGKKRKSVRLVEDGLLDDLSHDVELFILSGIAGKKEAIDVLTGEDTLAEAADDVINGTKED